MNCKAPECNKVVSAKGYCAMHYARWTRHGTLTTVKTRHFQKPDDTHRVCNRCKENKNLSEFRTNKGKSNVRSICRACEYKAVAMKKYNLTKQDFENLMLIKFCQLCGQEEPLIIDHDHSCCPTTPSCGKCIRGRICGHCNLKLGHVRDDIAWLNQSLVYLTSSTITK